jgi:hypothetical protein
MTDAKFAKLHLAVGLSPETLRARALRRRETAERLWDERLERLLLDEADELERRAVVLERETALDLDDDKSGLETETAPRPRAARRHQETKAR